MYSIEYRQMLRVDEFSRAIILKYEESYFLRKILVRYVQVSKIISGLMFMEVHSVRNDNFVQMGFISR